MGYADRNETYNVRLHIRLPRNLDGKKLNPGVKAVRPQQDWQWGVTTFKEFQENQDLLAT